MSKKNWLRLGRVSNFVSWGDLENLTEEEGFKLLLQKIHKKYPDPEDYRNVVSHAWADWYCNYEHKFLKEEE